MEQSPRNVTVLDGKDATIVCRAVGAPIPNITWTFGNGMFYYCIINKLLKEIEFSLFFGFWLFTDSAPVELSNRIQILETGDLLISNVRESDAGLYNCIRANEAGTVTGEAYLGVMGKK